MVESQQERDNEQDYIENNDNDNDLNTFMRSEYLQNCDLYNSSNINEYDIDSNSINSNHLEGSLNSIYSRPVSTFRLSQDLDDMYNITSSSKSQSFNQGCNDNIYMFKSNKSLDADGLNDKLI
ncbi:C-module-binding factor A [Drosophila mojavensis]|uniref:Uncharacterized protein n=1 Tax=Drosophila mojavensis TaxID=7230 RepID=B4L7H9_DROMO|nr:C-module-binding factor A [Drosophila mojavensis]EDW10973.1 uncharacterized protein Dmoj_GI14132 [Drosophila mojavensis]